jgi:hypothetical protein
VISKNSQFPRTVPVGTKIYYFDTIGVKTFVVDKIGANRDFLINYYPASIISEMYRHIKILYLDNTILVQSEYFPELFACIGYDNYYVESDI